MSGSLKEAEKWAGLFVQWRRPTYHIVKLHIGGNYFTGDAGNCFDLTLCEAENRALALKYWTNAPNSRQEAPIAEILADGAIEVAEIVEEINRFI